jgi:hypothetical protein
MLRTISTPVQTRTLLEEVHRFLIDNLLSWPEVTQNPESSSSISKPLLDEEHYVYVKQKPECLNDGGGVCRIGFRYSASCLEDRDYIWTVCRWIAIRFGRLVVYPDYPVVLPQLVYSGCDRIAVLPTSALRRSVPVPPDWTIVDAWGRPQFTQEDARFGQLAPEETYTRVLLLKEMKRLDEVWDRAYPKNRISRILGKRFFRK